MTFFPQPHQYVERSSQRVITEKLLGDRSVSFIYSTLRENAPAMFKALSSRRMSNLLSFYNYDFLDGKRTSRQNLFNKLEIDWQECLEDVGFYDTPRKVFERQIRYWQVRPMDEDPAAVVSPADSRILFGSLAEVSHLFIKEKFFSLPELLGTDSYWAPFFEEGDFALFRLTPDKYHYNHVPVSGRIVDVYEVTGRYHSCNPSALISLPSLYSKNKRVVTVIDTEVEGGSRVGLVAMIEIVALMIGDIAQAYSERRYDSPRDLERGMFVKKGCPKSLYRPGSSTDVLLFQAGSISFTPDLVFNSKRCDVSSRFSKGLGRPLVETDIKVRSTIAQRKSNNG